MYVSLFLSLSDISLDKVQRYINRIGCIYSSMDIYIKHGSPVGMWSGFSNCVVITWLCRVCF